MPSACCVCESGCDCVGLSSCGISLGLVASPRKLVASSSVGTSLQCVYNNCNSSIRVVLGLRIVFMSVPPY